uniref:RIIa domain-containing protein n=1 Tax=Leptobrachium leishanense TaxID=445787 RepID=A0A8C5QN95_9ANUR
MSVPFSNTNLRVPRGFGNLLEGLTREVLREQPGDIPLFASKYFETLLKQRQELKFEPAEWGASLDDRFYNNHAFNVTAQPHHPTTQLRITLQYTPKIPTMKLKHRPHLAGRSVRCWISRVKCVFVCVCVPVYDPLP